MYCIIFSKMHCARLTSAQYTGHFMHTISVLAAKGGVGKTLIASQLAIKACFNFRVGIADLDPTLGGITLWHEARNAEGEVQGPQLIGSTDPEEARYLAKRAGCNVLILDGPPGALELSRACAEVSDAVVLPTKISADDYKRLAFICAMCREADVRYMLIVVNDVLRDSLNQKYEQKVCKQMVDELNGEGFSTAVLKHASAFLRARSCGVGVHEMSGRGVPDAQLEIDHIYSRIVKRLGYSLDA